MEDPIRADNLSKCYGNKPVLDAVTFAVRPGECLAVFGLSGCGKSVLFRLLCGMQWADSGTVSHGNQPPAIAFSSPAFTGNLTPSEILWMHARLYGIPGRKRHAVVRSALMTARLESKRDKRLCTLTPTELKLLEVARALMAPVDVLLLDDPMSGLDFSSRQELWSHLLRLRMDDGKSIVVATSRPEDAELCDRIMLLHEGRVLALGTLEQLRALVGPDALVVKPLDEKQNGFNGKLWTGVVGRDQDGSQAIEMSPNARPKELLNQLPSGVSAIRYKPRSVSSILEELILRPGLFGRDIEAGQEESESETLQES
jgi:ABC-type multidrug transport system ATPase subunit